MIGNANRSLNPSMLLPWNSTEVEEWIPRKLNASFDNCKIRNFPNSDSSYKCESWVYDTTFHKSSRGIEWNFVCDRRWMGAVAQSAYMFGVFTGAVTLGSLADKFGRKTIFYISAVMQLFLGVVVSFIPEYYMFLCVSYLYGIFGSAGSYITGFVLTMELVGSSRRTACGVAFQATFAFGIMLVALWANFITDRTLLQIIYGLHSLLLIPHWWLIDESPRWLWAQGRISESVEIVAKGVRMNGGVPIDKAMYISRGLAHTRQQERENTSAGVTDMFRTPRLRLISLNVCLNWFSNSLAYYSLSLNTGRLFPAGLNPFIVLFIMGLVEIPSYIMTVVLLDRTGRRCLTASFMLIGAAACLLTAFIPTSTSVGTGISTAVVFVGKFCIAGSFAIIYNYSAELFPTVVRNTALGVGSMCARFSGTLTPLISLLDSFDKRVPIIIFATITLASGFLTLFLPETLNKSMPQSIDEGERFGVGDTCFATGCFGKKHKNELNNHLPMKSI